MKIIVCLKQVPESENIKIDSGKNTIIRENTTSILNPPDRGALETALKIKEITNGTVLAISMGPPQSEAILKDAIAEGADDAYLVSDKDFAGSDALVTAKILSHAIKFIGDYDIVICGKYTTNGDTGLVGSALAEFLNIPQITSVTNINIKNNKFLFQRVCDEEEFEDVEVTAPFLLTVVRNIFELRLPSLKGKIKAKNTNIKIITNADLKIPANEIGLLNSPTRVTRMFSAETQIRQSRCEMIDVKKLTDLLINYKRNIK